MRWDVPLYCGALWWFVPLACARQRRDVQHTTPAAGDWQNDRGHLVGTIAAWLPRAEHIRRRTSVGKLWLFKRAQPDRRIGDVFEMALLRSSREYKLIIMIV